MYQQFFGFSEKPFTLSPDPSFLYMSRSHQLALSMLEYGIENNAGFVLISGEVGCGKTTLIRKLLDNLQQEVLVGLISNTHRSFGELLDWVLFSFSIEHEGKSQAQKYQDFMNFLIARYAENRRVILIVDEAQNMDALTLEELRVLSNINSGKDQLLQIVLVGQPEIRETLSRNDLRQFAQRISVDYHLDPLNYDDVAQYIDHRVQTAGGEPNLFDKQSIRLIYNLSGGVPRLVNTYCDLALVYSFADQQKNVSWRTVLQIARDKKKQGSLGLRVQPA